MKRLPLLLLSGLVAVAFAACGGTQPETTPTPTGPNADSLRAAQQARPLHRVLAEPVADRVHRRLEARVARLGGRGEQIHLAGAGVA